MPTPTYTPLANITLGSTAASVTFSSISQLYRDLVLVATGTTSSAASILIQFNGDTGNNYNWVGMVGYGSVAESTYNTNGSMPVAHGNGIFETTVGGMFTASVMDFSATDKYKSLLIRSNNAAVGTYAVAGRWANTAAITSLLVRPAGGSQTFSSGTSLALYGIAA